jgi:hypothetical protein
MIFNSKRHTCDACDLSILDGHSTTSPTPNPVETREL